METSVRFILLGVGVVIILLIIWDGLRRKKRQDRDAPIRTINLKKIKEKVAEKQAAAQPAAFDEFDDGIVGEARVVSSTQETVKSSVDYEPIPSPVPMPEPARIPQPIRHQQGVPAEMQFVPSNRGGADTQVLERPQVAKPTVQAETHFVMLHIKAPDIEPFGGYRLLQVLLGRHLQFGKHGFFHAHESSDPKSNVLFSLSSEKAPGSFDPKKMGDYECAGLVLFMNMTKHKRPLLVFDQMLETARELSHELGGELQAAPGRPCTEESLTALRNFLKAKEL